MAKTSRSWAPLVAALAICACAAFSNSSVSSGQEPPLRFVRGGLVLGSAAEPVQASGPDIRDVIVNGLTLPADRMPDQSGWLVAVRWKPRERIALSWREGGRTRGLAAAAPLVPEAVPWLSLPWPPQSVISAGEQDVVTALAFSPDARWLAAGSQQGRVTVIAVSAHATESELAPAPDTVPGTVRWTLQRPGRVIRHVAFSVDGRLLLVGEQGPEGRLAAYDPAAGTAPVWSFDCRAALGGESDQDAARVAAAERPAGAYSWIDQAGVYALLPTRQGVLVACSQSWQVQTGWAQRLARARLYELESATGKPRWAFPAARAMPRLITWLAADDSGARVALPIQWPAGGPPPAVSGQREDWSDLPSHVVIRAGGGRLELNQAILPLPPARFASFWRGVALRPDGGALAVSTDDGRGLLFHRRREWQLASSLTLVAPLRIAGVDVTATNGTLAVTAARVIFATGPSYSAQGSGDASQQLPAHPRGNTLFAYDWSGGLRWAWKLEGDLQALAADRQGETLAVLQGSERRLEPGAFQGLTLLRLSDAAKAADGAGRVLLRFPLQGRAPFGGLALAARGDWIAVAESPRLVQGDARPVGAYRLWVLR